MDLALNNPQRLICHKTLNQPTINIIHAFTQLNGSKYCYVILTIQLTSVISLHAVK